MECGTTCRRYVIEHTSWRGARRVYSLFRALCAPGPKRPRFTGGAPAADLSDWG